MINFHCTIIPVVVLDSVITYTSAWYLDREIYQLVTLINPYSVLNLFSFIVYLYKYITKYIILMIVTSRSLIFICKNNNIGTYLFILVYRCLLTIMLT